jgi:hypothetical protein
MRVLKRIWGVAVMYGVVIGLPTGAHHVAGICGLLILVAWAVGQILGTAH